MTQSNGVNNDAGKSLLEILHSGHPSFETDNDGFSKNNLKNANHLKEMGKNCNHWCSTTRAF